jgi:hypothetical protein
VRQEWIDLMQADLDPVFGFTPQWDYEGPLLVSVSARESVVSFESQPVERITVHQGLEFSFPPSREPNLGSYSADVTYIRRNGRFVYEATRHEKPSPELDKLFDIWLNGAPSNDDYLHAFLPQFEKIAASKDADDLFWLNGFLENCKNTPKKRAILALLPK